MTEAVEAMNIRIQNTSQFDSQFLDIKGLPQRRKMCGGCPGHMVGYDPDITEHRCHSNTKFVCASVVKDQQ